MASEDKVVIYRTDIGERWHRDGDLLQTWGYLL